MLFRLEARDGIYWALFIRSLDMAAVNAWILYKLLHGSSAMDQKEFRRRHAVVSYLHVNLNRKRGQPLDHQLRLMMSGMTEWDI